jgi:hypothetical protein
MPSIKCLCNEKALNTLTSTTVQFGLAYTQWPEPEPFESQRRFAQLYETR